MPATHDFRHTAAGAHAGYNVSMQVQMWSKAAYIAAGLAYALPAFVAIWDGSLAGWRAITWLTAGAVFSVLFAVSVPPGSVADHRRTDVYRIVAQTLAGFTMVLVSVGLSRYTSALTLVMVAQQLPGVFSRRTSWLWVTSQSVVLGAIFWWFDGWLAGLSGGGAYAGIQVFAFGKALLERSEREAREALSRTNAELHATRELLAENSRAAERLRISRDLHDTLGHHLTALSIQLDVASRRSEGPAAEHIREAHAITRLLLSDVRDVVSQLRESGRIDLVEAIRSIAAGGGEPRVHLDMPQVLYLESAAPAHAMIRCVQEIITNAARHARARNVWIRITARDSGLELTAHDDGHGVADLVYGHGLKGMKERFEENAGRVEFTTAPGRGFEVHAFMPQISKAAS